MSARRSKILAIVVLSAAVGCGRDKSETLSPVAIARPDLAEAECGVAIAAATQFAEDVREGRADAVAERFDLEAFVRGVCIGTGCTQKVRRDFARGFETGLAQRAGGLMAGYLSQDFRFMRLVNLDDSTQMLFRAWDEEAGVDYLRCAFDKVDGEDWKIVDVMSYTSGEPFTESVRRTYLPVLAGGERASALRERFEPLATVVDKLDAGDHLGARRALVALSDGLRGQRFARVLELEVLAAIEDAAEDYAVAVEAFEKDYPADPSLPLRMLEVHSIRGEHEQGLQRVDQIEALLEGDPFLHFLRAGALTGLGRGGEAVAGLKQAITAEPSIEELRWALVHAALPERAFGAVAETLRALRTDFEYQLGVGDLEGAEEYREFLKSPEGKELLKEIRAGEPRAGDCN